jgi:UDP-N-acetylglucosamine 2-epimerase
MIKRKIAIVTGTRAEYGLLFWLMKEIQDDSELQLQLIVTGMHLSPEFGLTSDGSQNTHSTFTWWRNYRRRY